MRYARSKNNELLNEIGLEHQRDHIRILLPKSEMAVFFSSEKAVIVFEYEKVYFGRYYLSQFLADWLKDINRLRILASFIDETVAEDNSYFLKIFGSSGVVLESIVLDCIKVWFPDKVGWKFHGKEKITDSNYTAMIYDILKYHPSDRPPLPYSLRIHKTEDAPSYLKRVYAFEIAKRNLTLSDLRIRDEGLWRALRNWAHHGGHDLEALIPRGESRGGRPLLDPGFDPAALNPNDPVQAAALKLVERREANRLAMRTRRQAAKLAK